MPSVRDIMSKNPATCTPDTSVEEIARLMVQFDCGSIPVVGADDNLPVGTVTDRDIVCRLVAKGTNPLEYDAKDCMTTPCVTVRADADLVEARDLMGRNKIRRVVCVDDQGKCCGIVSLADVVCGLNDVGVVRDLSQPTEAPSEVPAEKVPEPA